MIRPPEINAAGIKFGAPDTQIARDHLISHVLATIGDWPAGWFRDSHMSNA